jgi:cyclic nucleotide gated channel alpha 1
MFALLICSAHVFALMLYAVSAASPKNWLVSVRIDRENWLVQYIYSVYWAITTMVTVGYGDITPQNQYEVLVVMAVEIVGTSIFGYMINIIGMSLAEMKKERETLDHELSVADKICKCFHVSGELAYRMKNDLTNSHLADRSFSLQEEAQVIDKLNPMLRSEILRDTNSRVIRKSLFFLTHFTWTAQMRLSLRLVKKVVQPTEVLVGAGSIYIIDKGQMTVQLIRNHRSRVFTKNVKTIIGCSDVKNDGISKNAYGYTEAITGRKTNTKAVSNSFTIAFELTRKDFL